jgi:hypothetical protein
MLKKPGSQFEFDISKHMSLTDLEEEYLGKLEEY